MTIDEMRKIKDQRGYSMSMLALYSGVPQGTLTKIFNGTTAHPRPSTLAAIQRVLEADEKVAKGKAAVYQEQSATIFESRQDDCCMHETSGAYTAPVPYYEDGKDNHTIKEYFALPEKVRKELIDGRFYDMATPTFVHQAIAGEAYASLLSQIRARKGSCKVFISPIGVQLDMDQKTVVEPDVMIVCRKDKFLKRTYFGAPDFVLEILSPSTKKKDMTLKLGKYVNAGVREFVMIDPERRMILAYQIENNMNYVMKPLEGSYPLAIYDGEITLDLDSFSSLIDEFDTDQEEPDEEFRRE